MPTCMNELLVSHKEKEMAEQPHQEESLARQAEAAIKDAAKKVAQEARRTGTPVVVWQHGAVAEIPADQLPIPPEPAR